MDLNARVYLNIVRVDVNFQTSLRPVVFLHVDIVQHQGPTYTPYKISAKNTKRKFSNITATCFRCRFFLHVDIVQHQGPTYTPYKISAKNTKPFWPSRVAQSVGHLTRKSGVLGSIPGLATYFRFSFRFFKKGSCQLLAKVCARSTG